MFWSLASGVNEFYLIGMSGGLKDLDIGTILITNEAIRNEGASYHYLEKE